jgi:hypothetical protein
MPVAPTVYGDARTIHSISGSFGSLGNDCPLPKIGT